MTKLIYRELSVDETIKRLKEMTSTIQPYRYTDEAIYSAIRYLEKAEEGPKGEWIEKVHQDCFGTKETICPFCNFSMVEWWGVKNYCPSCGAELHEKGKKNDNNKT